MVAFAQSHCYHGDLLSLKIDRDQFWVSFFKRFQRYCVNDLMWKLFQKKDRLVLDRKVNEIATFSLSTIKVTILKTTNKFKLKVNNIWKILKNIHLIYFWLSASISQIISPLLYNLRLDLPDINLEEMEKLSFSTKYCQIKL